MNEEEKKKFYSYLNQYTREKYDRVSVNVKKGTKDKWKKYAEEAGMSLAAYVSEAVEEKHSRENA